MPAHKKLQMPSLIQGISQQSEQSINPASAKDQKNCINDLLLGARARNGSAVQGVFSDVLTDPFFFEIYRDDDEHYVVTIEADELIIYNVAEGVKATITGDISAYLTAGEPERTGYAAATVEDTTFLANKSISPAMDSATSDARPNWAIAHFKSANYSTVYKLHITVGANTYTTSYTTPDNSTASNADFIATNRLAEELYDVLVATTIPAMTSAGDTGFSAERDGSTVLLKRSSAGAFTVSTEDGLGGEQFIAFVDRVKELDDLPATAFDGYVVTVGSGNGTTDFDYFLQYSGSGQQGVWEEIVAPSTETDLDADTMPHILTNTGKNAFTVSTAPWGSRLAGDGDRTAKDPSFVGDYIKDLQFIDGRLAIICEGNYSMSKAGNAYVFFPDTAQTTLDTDPVIYNVANGKVTLLSQSVAIGKRLQLWANKIQLIVSSGQEPIKESTVENVPITNYEYDGLVAPEARGLTSLIFGTALGSWINFMEVFFRGEQPQGEIDVSGQCPKLVKGTLRNFAVGDRARFLLVVTSEAGKLYVYQWYNSGEERLQSAWNVWEFNGPERVLWAGMVGSQVRLIFSWGDDGVSIEHLETDYESDGADLVPLRCDNRVDETYVTGEGTGYRILTLPYPVPSTKRANFVAFERLNDDETGEQRGRLLTLAWQSDTVVWVYSEIPEVNFHAGFLVNAERVFPRPYIRDREGTILFDEIIMRRLRVSHKNATTYDVEIRPTGSESTRSESYTARRIGDPQVVNNRIAVNSAGEHSVPIGYEADEAEVALVNNTIYPSSWAAATLYYEAIER